LKPPTQAVAGWQAPGGLVGTPPTLTYSVWPGVTASLPATRAPRPARWKSVSSPGAPMATTSMLSTPAGTVKLSSAPVKANAHVVVPPVREQVGAAPAVSTAATPSSAAAVTAIVKGLSLRPLIELSLSGCGPSRLAIFRRAPARDLRGTPEPPPELSGRHPETAPAVRPRRAWWQAAGAS
jgi:hypothetical protein